ncbi:recombinase family protein [Streptomyces sp. NPDC002490]|uniref:recombinase family protein n=1 Tax=Streptomyces sp. NPDC002490 TaxID=3154416 RepID=UPI00332443FA
MIERPYDGCGTCLLGVRRLSRMKLATTSPERQRADVLAVAASIGGHIVGWADDWEVSGATAPMTRPKLGPWLRDERGPYDGLVAAAVDRLGRNVVDCLNTGYKMRDEGKLLLTHGHDGPWDLNEPVDENRCTMDAWGAQMELRAIQRRNRDTTVRGWLQVPQPPLLMARRSVGVGGPWESARRGAPEAIG